MTPSELAKSVEEDKEWLAAMEVETEPYDPLPDLWESLDLLGTALEKLEFMIKVDGEVGFLSVAERAELLIHTAEVLTFTDLWKNEPDPKITVENATGEVVEFEDEVKH